MSRGRKRKQLKEDAHGVIKHAVSIARAPHRELSTFESCAAGVAFLILIGIGSVAFVDAKHDAGGPPFNFRWPELQLGFIPPDVVPLDRPVRDEPRNFPARSMMPARKEDSVSGPVNRGLFYPKTDLIRIDDPRVWYESDYDKNDTEEDRIFHRAMEEPMRRLIELVHQAGGRLEVHDAFRGEGIHKDNSLHKEGRAVDITDDVLGLERLAKLAWASGFDWVYYEVPKNGGAHIHASVRADRRYVAKTD